MKYRAQEDSSENGFPAEKFHPSKHRDANFAFNKLIKTFSGFFFFFFLQENKEKPV